MALITSIVIGAITLAIFAAACTNAVTLTPTSPQHLPTPNRAEVIIGEDAPPDVTSPDAKRFYRDGFKHMRATEWFSAVAACSEVIHLHPNAASAYAAHGTTHLYGGDHQDAINDYTTAIKSHPITRPIGAAAPTPTRLRRHPSPRRASRTPTVR